MIFRDLLGGVKQKSEDDELTSELLAEIMLIIVSETRLRRKPTVIGDGYRFYETRIEDTYKIEWYSRFFVCLV